MSTLCEESLPTKEKSYSAETSVCDPLLRTFILSELKYSTTK